MAERRDGPRIDLRLRVRYRVGETGETLGEAEASDVSPKGLRLESEKPVEKGTLLHLQVDAGEVEELECMGQVTWCRPRVSPTGKTMYDLGVAFESDWLARDRGPLGSILRLIGRFGDRIKAIRRQMLKGLALSRRPGDGQPIDAFVAA